MVNPMKKNSLMSFLKFFSVLGILLSVGCNSEGGAYYTYDDLVSTAELYKREFYYDNQTIASNGDVGDIMPPLTASWVAALKKAKLEGRPTPYILIKTIDFYDKKANVPLTKRVRAVRKQGVPFKKTTLGVQSINGSGFYREITINWDDLNAYPSDMIFVRGQSSFNKLVTGTFSSWTHVAMIWNKKQHLVLESMPDSDGVAIRNADQSWKSVISYGTKSVNPSKIPHFDYYYEDSNGSVSSYVGSGMHYNAMIKAYDKYRSFSYWPQYVDSSITTKLNFFSDWSDKNDKDSMYCSKLVYWTFKDANSSVNLDSDRTQIYVPGLYNGGTTNRKYGWIGVSPDDIWGSDDTSEYWELVSAENLYNPFN